MAGSLHSALTADTKRRREQAERKAAATPPEEIRARNQCIDALAVLRPERARTVVLGIARSIEEFLVVYKRSVGG
jgi:hypothetical protein